MTWTTAKFLTEFRASTDKLAGTIERKNADYAGDVDPFANFRLIEAVSQGRISAEAGIIVRITDKLARLATLEDRGPAVADESFADTTEDLAGYAIILGLLRRSRTEPNEVAPIVPVDPASPAPTPWDLLRAAIAQAAGRGQQEAQQ